MSALVSLLLFRFPRLRPAGTSLPPPLPWCRVKRLVDRSACRLSSAAGHALTEGSIHPRVWQPRLVLSTAVAALSAACTSSLAVCLVHLMPELRIQL